MKNVGNVRFMRGNAVRQVKLRAVLAATEQFERIFLREETGPDPQMVNSELNQLREQYTELIDNLHEQAHASHD